MKLSTGALVYIEWLDHSGAASRWEHESDFDVAGFAPALVRSVGWVWRETPEALTIVQNWAEHSDEECEPEVTGVHCIVKSCIKLRIELSLPNA